MEDIRFTLLDIRSDAELAADAADREWARWCALSKEEQRLEALKRGIGASKRESELLHCEGAHGENLVEFCGTCALGHCKRCAWEAAKIAKQQRNASWRSNELPHDGTHDCKRCAWEEAAKWAWEEAAKIAKHWRSHVDP